MAKLAVITVKGENQNIQTGNQLKRTIHVVRIRYDNKATNAEKNVDHFFLTETNQRKKLLNTITESKEKAKKNQEKFQKLFNRGLIVKIQLAKIFEGIDEYAMEHTHSMKTNSILTSIVKEKQYQQRSTKTEYYLRNLNPPKYTK